MSVLPRSLGIQEGTLSLGIQEGTLSRGIQEGALFQFLNPKPKLNPNQPRPTSAAAVVAARSVLELNLN